MSPEMRFVWVWFAGWALPWSWHTFTAGFLAGLLFGLVALLAAGVFVAVLP